VLTTDRAGPVALPAHARLHTCTSRRAADVPGHRRPRVPPLPGALLKSAGSTASTARERPCRGGAPRRAPANDHPTPAGSHSAGDSARAGLGFCPHRYWWATPWSHGGGAADTCVAPLVRPRPLARCSARRYENAPCSERWSHSGAYCATCPRSPRSSPISAPGTPAAASPPSTTHWSVARCSRRWSRCGSRNSPLRGRVPIRRSP
jgi:hypothetical protein